MAGNCITVPIVNANRLLLSPEIVVLLVMSHNRCPVIYTQWGNGIMGYWHQRADERHGNPPQGNRELLAVKDKVERNQVSLG